MSNYHSTTNKSDPWRRLAARIVVRAVLDLRQGSTRQKIDGAHYLADPEVQQWANEWGLQIPWNKITSAARHEIDKARREEEAQ